MKKILLLAIAVVAFATVSAQNKGDKYVGGIIGVSTASVITDGTSINSTSFSIAPEFAFFVANKLRIGGVFNYTLGASQGDVTHSVEFGPELAYYVRLCDKFYYVPSFCCGFAYTHLEDVSGVGFELGLGLGSFEFRPTKHFGLAMNLLTFSYAYQHYSDLDASGSSIGLKLGINPSVGLRYYF